MDLSKAFDSIDHKLLVAKQAAYGPNSQSLAVIQEYLNNRLQRTKVGLHTSSWLLMKHGVPQGSILGPLLFNIFINDFVHALEKTDLCNFADDNTIYSTADSLATVMDNLEHDIKLAVQCFRINQLAVNPSKFQMIILGIPMKSLPISIMQVTV